MTCKSSCFPKFNNPDCCEIEIDTEKCNTNNTVCNGEYGEWTSTHECTKSCIKNINDKSTKLRSRQVYRSVKQQWGKTYFTFKMYFFDHIFDFQILKKLNAMYPFAYQNVQPIISQN